MSTPKPASDEQPSADNNVVPLIGGLAVGGTIGYLVGQQRERNRNNNEQRQPPRRANSPTPQARVSLPELDSAPMTANKSGVEEERVKIRLREKMRELESQIYRTLHLDPYGFDWVHQCKQSRVRSNSHKIFILCSVFPPWRLGRLRERRERERERERVMYLRFETRPQFSGRG